MKFSEKGVQESPLIRKTLETRDSEETHLAFHAMFEEKHFCF